MDRESWCAVIYGVTKSRTRLSDRTELIVGNQLKQYIDFLPRLMMRHSLTPLMSMSEAFFISLLSKGLSRVFSNTNWKAVSLVQFSSVTRSCLTLCDPMNCSTPGLPVHQQLLEFTQTHVHRVGDAIQPSHPLLSPSPPAPNPSQHQSLFQ